MNVQQLAATDIEQMNYVQFISLIRETNRCPGGKNTIRKILQNSFINQNSRVLDIGCNTGFTSLEIARTIGCKVVGIDVAPEALESANLLLQMDIPEIQKLVTFQQGSALNLEFPDNYFDLVVTGGATSFMDDKQRAISEYHRVLKPWGFLSVTNLCYVEEPPQKIVDAVSEIIGVQINPWSSDDWYKVFDRQKKFETYLFENYRLFPQAEKVIDHYVEYFMNKEHLLGYDTETRDAIRKRWRNTISLFNENHKYLGFILVLLRKDHIKEELELFSQTELITELKFQGQ